MDLSWDEGETSTHADGEDRLSEVRDPTPPPQANAAAGPRLEEATLVEGTHPITTSSYSGQYS